VSLERCLDGWHIARIEVDARAPDESRSGQTLVPRHPRDVSRARQRAKSGLFSSVFSTASRERDRYSIQGASARGDSSLHNESNGCQLLRENRRPSATLRAR